MNNPTGQLQRLVGNGKVRQPGVQRMVVTPEIAGDWLASVSHNRPVSPLWVGALADRILRGEWEFNGDAIRFDAAGHLIDGQHRLLAVIQAGMPIVTLVVFGLEAPAMDTIDIGKRRSIGDIMFLHGETDATALASTVNYVWTYKTHGTWLVNQKQRATPAQLLAVLDQHPSIRQSILIGHRAGRKVREISRNLAAALHYLFSERDRTRADEFFELLASGAGLELDDPIYRLRERLMNPRRKFMQRPMPLAEVAALTIKAWNAYSQGRRLRVLVWRPGQGEAFPSIE